MVEDLLQGNTASLNSKCEKAAKKKLKKFLSIVDHKQQSQVRELLIRYYGKVIGNVAWNFLLLLYQQGSLTTKSQLKDDSKDEGVRTKRLIKKLATKTRSSSAIEGKRTPAMTQHGRRNSASVTKGKQLKN